MVGEYSLKTFSKSRKIKMNYQIFVRYQKFKHLDCGGGS